MWSQQFVIPFSEACNVLIRTLKVMNFKVLEVRNRPCQGQVPGSMLLPFSMKFNAALYLVWLTRQTVLACLVIKPLAQLHKGMALFVT